MVTISKLVKLSKKGQLVVPQKIREKMGLESGKKVVIFMRGDETILLTPEKYASYTCGMLKRTWGSTKEEVESYINKERSSWK